MDVHTPERRSFNMSRIRSVDTQPEMTLRRALHSRGLRYRLHARDLPGTPDIVLPRRHAAIQVQGCFWHGHDCPMFRLPSTRPDFWRAKIDRNVARDQRSSELLAKLGWRLLTVWECALKGRARLPVEDVAERSESFLLGDALTGEIAGDWERAGRLKAAKAAP